MRMDVGPNLIGAAMVTGTEMGRRMRMGAKRLGSGQKERDRLGFGEKKSVQDKWLA